MSHPQQRRSSMTAVVIALVFLSILGASVGVILGTNENGQKNVANSTGTTPSPTVTVTETPSAAASATTPTTQATTPTQTTTTTKSYPPTAPHDCPRQTEERAGADMSVTLYIRTATAEVWICQGNGRTVYQGHLLNKPFTAETSDYTLFINGPHQEGDVWIATNGTTDYVVSREFLLVERNGADVSNEPVEEAYP